MPDKKSQSSSLPWIAGGLAGMVEISVTYPLEFAKTELQLQQAASGMASPNNQYRGVTHCFTSTIKQHGTLGVYKGCESWFIASFPRSAVRFGVYEQLSRMWGAAGHQKSLWSDMAIGTVAGAAEGALCQTPNQAIQIKIVHDSSPTGPKAYKNFPHAVRSIYNSHGFVGGFFSGVGPCTLKVALNTCIRFTVYNQLVQAMRRDPKSPIPASLQSLTAGAVGGAVSAVVSHPLDTIKANMMGLDASRYNSGYDCMRKLVAQGGWRCLFNGLQPRVFRVMLEVGLQFALYEEISSMLSKVI